jgi:hypothetical protein
MCEILWSNTAIYNRKLLVHRLGQGDASLFRLRPDHNWTSQHCGLITTSQSLMAISMESPSCSRKTTSRQGRSKSKADMMGCTVVTGNCVKDDQLLQSSDMELHLLKTLTPVISENEILPTPSPQSTEMARKDSGWSESPIANSQTTSRRNSKSASTSRRNSPSKPSRKTHRPTDSSSSSTRPSTRRASKSSE